MELRHTSLLLLFSAALGACDRDPVRTPAAAPSGAPTLGEIHAFLDGWLADVAAGKPVALGTPATIDLGGSAIDECAVADCVTSALGEHAGVLRRRLVQAVLENAPLQPPAPGTPALTTVAVHLDVDVDKIDGTLEVGVARTPSGLVVHALHAAFMNEHEFLYGNHPEGFNEEVPEPFDRRVNAAPAVRAERVDATGLGTWFEASLVRRAGAYRDFASEQSVDVSLVLLGHQGVQRIALGAHDVRPAQRAPFGEIVANPPFAPRRYAEPQHGYDGAPDFPSKSDVLLSDQIVLRPDSNELVAYVVTREKNALVVWTAQNDAEDPSGAWSKVTTVAIADGAVIEPTYGTSSPDASAGDPVRLFELVGEKTVSWHTVDLALAVGGRVGPIDQCFEDHATVGERELSLGSRYERATCQLRIERDASEVRVLRYYEDKWNVEARVPLPR